MVRTRGKVRRTWGVYTLGFLALVFVMLLVSTSQKHYTVLTLAGLLVGLGGAAYCTVKGLMQFGLPRRR